MMDTAGDMALMGRSISKRHCKFEISPDSNLVMIHDESSGNVLQEQQGYAIESQLARTADLLRRLNTSQMPTAAKNSALAQPQHTSPEFNPRKLNFPP